MAQITSGVKITVDASDIQNKFTKSIDQLNASLSRNQKALGLVYNEQGLLTNALGQNVEGLAQSAVKLGQYVDELGRVRTFQGGFVDGLNRSQIEMGQYADELGNIYSRTGELIGQTEKARRAIEAEAAAQEKAAAAASALGKAQRDALTHAAQGVAGVAGQFAAVQAILSTAGEDADGLGRSVAAAASGLSAAAGAFSSATALLNGFSETAAQLPGLLASVGARSAAAAPALAGVAAEATTAGAAFAAMGGPVTLALSAIAAVGVGVAAYSQSTKTTSTLSASFQDLEAKAAKAGKTIKGIGDALRFGAFELPVNDLKNAAANMNEAQAALDDARARFEEAQAKAAAAVASGGMGAGGVRQPDLNDFNITALDETYKNALAEYNAVAAKYVEAARAEQMTEAEKLEEQKKVYEELAKKAGELGDEANRSTLERQVELINGKILDIKKEEENAAREAAEAEKKAAEQAAELAEKVRADVLRSVGVDLPGVTSDAVDALDKLAQAVEAGTITQEDYNAAAEQIAEKRKADQLAALGVTLEVEKTYADKVAELSAMLEAGSVTHDEYNRAAEQLRDAARAAVPGLDSLADDPVREDYEKALKAAADALEAGVISEEEAAAMKKKAAKKYADALDAAAKRQNAGEETPEQKREKQRRALGVDALMESIKSPLQKYRETLDAIAEANRAGAISRAEEIALTQKAAKTYRATLEDATPTASAFSGAGSSSRGATSAASLSSGSESLYLALVRNASGSYQNTMQKTTADIYETAAASLYQQQQTNAYLATLAEAGGASFGVFG